MNSISSKALKSDLLLLLTAAIWGFAFVAQKKGMESCGPFMFNGIRFALGGVILLPFLLTKKLERLSKHEFGFAVLTGLVLFIAASLQQVGVIFTTAGNAGFITGLYVIFVPLIGIMMKQKVTVTIWISIALAILGLYAISFTGKMDLVKGDLLVLVGAVLWAVHVQLIGKAGKMVGVIRLAIIQFLICSVLSLLIAILFEENTYFGVKQAIYPILYGGLLSVGIAYTLQIVAQKHSPPSHAAIILSMEGLFAVLGGVLMLAEKMSLRSGLGFFAMLAAMILAQISQIRNNKS